MKILFTKYEGTGNDFIIIDNREIQWHPTTEEVAFMCDRHFGIGADGLMLLSEMKGYDFSMTYFNSDGHESTMCGNGGRCISAFANGLGIAGPHFHFHAIDGGHEAIWYADDHEQETVRLKMSDVQPATLFEDGALIDTGSPHFVITCKQVDRINVVETGRKIRYEARFQPRGVNVDFMEVTETGLYVRTYERGVENETLSCGTGVTASALIHASRQSLKSDRITIETPGGRLTVSFVNNGGFFSNVWLEGPATRVFQGEIRLKGSV